MVYTKEDFDILMEKVKDGLCSFRSFCILCKSHYMEFITERTIFLDRYTPSQMERIYCVYHNILELPQCPHCGGKKKFNEKHPSYHSTCCSKECNSKELSSSHEGQTKISENRDTEFVIKQRGIAVVDDSVVRDLIKYDKFVPLIDNPIILDYLNSRYNDSSSLLETVQRIRFGVEDKPTCPTCGRPVTWIGKKSHLYTKYCSNLKCSANNDETKKLKKDALIEHWGGSGCYNTEKYRSMMLEKYGVETHMQREGVAEKRKKTLLEKYGTTTVYEIPGVRDKVKDTCLKKFGTECVMALPEVRMKLYETSMRNSKTKKSKKEDELYDILVRLGYKTERWKMSEDFPYNVDFYLPDYDLYIEYQGSQYHNGRAYLGTKKDNEELERLLAKDNERGGKSQYGKIVYVWSVLDVKKRNEARDKHIKFLEIYSFKNAEDIERQIDMFLRFCGERELIEETDDALFNEYTYYKSMHDEELRGNSSNRNLIVRYFQQNVFYAKERESFVYDPVVRRKVIQNRIEYLGKKEWEVTTSDVLRGYKVSGEVYGYSHFNPRWANFVITKYGAKSVYDPCGGWGHHLLGMLSCDKVIYNDKSADVCEGIRRMTDRFGINGIEIHNEDAECFAPDNVDMFFACPPYYNVEIYDGGPFDSEKDYSKFLNRLFEIWDMNGAKTFCIVLREDFVKCINREYKESYELSVSVSHFSKRRKHNERIYVFEK